MSLAKSFGLVHIPSKQKCLAAMAGSPDKLSSSVAATSQSLISTTIQITPADSHDHKLRKGIAVEPYVLRSIFSLLPGPYFILFSYKLPLTTS